MERLEELAARADRMTTPENKARLMAAICSAADEHAPQRAVDVLKGLTADPNNEALHQYLFENLAYLQVSPTAKMSEVDRQDVIARVLDYDTANQDLAVARSLAIAKTVRHLDLLSSAPIYERLYDTALNAPDKDDTAIAISTAAQRIAEQMRVAEPVDHAKLTGLASDLVDRALQLGSDAFDESLVGLRDVLPSISDQQRRALVKHVLKFPQTDDYRMPTTALLLQSRAALDEKQTNDLLEAMG